MKNRKQTIILILALISSTLLYSQEYFVDFAILNSDEKPESIAVTNLDDGNTLTFTGEDILRLWNSVSVNKIEVENRLLTLSPNPSNGSVNIAFSQKQNGETTLRLYNLLGKELASQNYNLSTGEHRFLLKGVPQGEYLVEANCPTGKSCGKLVIQNSNGGNMEFSYLQSQTGKQKSRDLKKSASEISMWYEPEDRLRFLATYQGEEYVIYKVFNEDATLSFEFLWDDCGIVEDFDGNLYNTVVVGEQCWLKENLRTHYQSDGTPLTIITEEILMANLPENLVGCFDEDPKRDAGPLYTFNAAVSSCPEGWHLPSSDEYDTLSTAFGGNGVSGGYVKEKGYENWLYPNTGATDIGGLSMQGGGTMHPHGHFYDHEKYTGFFWTSTIWSGYEPNHLYVRLNNDDTFYEMDHGSYNRRGFSIRCIKD